MGRTDDPSDASNDRIWFEPPVPVQRRPPEPGASAEEPPAVVWPELAVPRAEPADAPSTVEARPTEPRRRDADPAEPWANAGDRWLGADLLEDPRTQPGRLEPSIGGAASAPDATFVFGAEPRGRRIGGGGFARTLLTVGLDAFSGGATSASRDWSSTSTRAIAVPAGTTAICRPPA